VKGDVYWWRKWVDFLRGSACAVITWNSECSADFGEARGTTSGTIMVWFSARSGIFQKLSRIPFSEFRSQTEFRSPWAEFRFARTRYCVWKCQKSRKVIPAILGGPGNQSIPLRFYWEAPEIKKCQKIDQKFPFWSCQNRLVTSQELPICTTCTCVVQNGKSWLFRTEI
jgi:hypothetical protein